MTAEQVEMLEKARLPRKLAVYAKLNTGMNRLGFSEKDLGATLERLKRCAGEITLMTHFADADGKRGVRWQLERFEAMTRGAQLPRSLANSAAILRFPETHADWVTAGDHALRLLAFSRGKRGKIGPEARDDVFERS